MVAEKRNGQISQYFIENTVGRLGVQMIMYVSWQDSAKQSFLGDGIWHANLQFYRSQRWNCGLIGFASFSFAGDCLEACVFKSLLPALGSRQCTWNKGELSALGTPACFMQGDFYTNY